MATTELGFQDRFELFEQMNLHQRLIDTPWGKESAQAYIDLYWPEGQFVVNDVRHTVFAEASGLKRMFDYAHSVFPLDKMFHTMGPFEIKGAGETAQASWRWLVNWKQDHKGILSTGTYTDRFEKRDGIWKCLERVSTVDPNFPAEVFEGWAANAASTFRES